MSIKGVIYGAAPVQAEGTVLGFPFYFRARYDQWSFAISEDPAVDLVDIQLPEAGRKYGYLAEGALGGTD